MRKLNIRNVNNSPSRIQIRSQSRDSLSPWTRLVLSIKSPSNTHNVSMTHSRHLWLFVERHCCLVDCVFHENRTHIRLAQCPSNTLPKAQGFLTNMDWLGEWICWLPSLSLFATKVHFIHLSLQPKETELYVVLVQCWCHCLLLW